MELTAITPDLEKFCDEAGLDPWPDHPVMHVALPNGVDVFAHRSGVFVQIEFDDSAALPERWLSTALPTPADTVTLAATLAARLGFTDLPEDVMPQLATEFDYGFICLS
jgi:hypothetical protein